MMDGPQKFRKRPVVIEAIQYGPYSVPSVAVHLFLSGSEYRYGGPEGLVIKTLEGEHIASVGDWIIKGVKGEFYFCKPDIFAMTYDMVEPPPPSP